MLPERDRKMKRAVIITSMLMLMMTISCRKAKTSDQELTTRLVGTWVCEDMGFQVRTTYAADGSWSLQSYPIRMADGWKSSIKHKLLGIIGKDAATYKLGFSSKGSWRIKNGRLHLQEDMRPDSSEDLNGLSETSWIKARGSKRYQYVKLARWESMTDAEILAYHGTITGALADPYEGMASVDINDKGRQAYLLAKAYLVYGDYESARDRFEAMRREFPRNKYAMPTLVHLHISKAGAAIKQQNWAESRTEYDLAGLAAKQFQAQSDRGTTFHSWAVTIREHIRELDSERIAQRAFANKVNDIRKLHDAGQYDEATMMLDSFLEEPGAIPFGKEDELRALKDAIVRKQALDDCQSLLDTARKVDSVDHSEKLAAYDRAWTALERHKQNIDPDKWKTMVSETLKARKTLTKMIVLQEIMDKVARARASGDNVRLLKALEECGTKPGVPRKLVEAWTEEVKKIQEKEEFAKVTKLLVEDQPQEAIYELKTFIKKYPKNKRAVLILRALTKRNELIRLRKEADALYAEKNGPRPWRNSRYSGRTIAAIEASGI